MSTNHNIVEGKYIKIRSHTTEINIKSILGTNSQSLGVQMQTYRRPRPGGLTTIINPLVPQEEEVEQVS